MVKNLSKIIEALPDYLLKAQAIKESLLANLVMVGEIPAPTFGEIDRVEFLRQRFSEFDLETIRVDDYLNVEGTLPGRDGKKNILLVAHTDTLFRSEINHTMAIHPNEVTGAGVCDNSMGLAALITLPTYLDRLGVTLKSNLVLVGVSRSLGRGNLEGLRHFLEKSKKHFRAGICIEGVQLGRLSLNSIGMLRGEIRCTMPSEYDWSRFGATGAIVTLNEVINKIVEIPLPRRPRTSVIFGSIRGGSTYNVLASETVLKFEIRSEDAEQVRRIGDRVEDIVAEVSSSSGANVVLDVFAHREPGGIPSGHPLARNARLIMDALDIKPRIFPSTSELSAMIDQSLPAITIGMTNGKDFNEPDESVEIEPMYKGMSHLVGILQAIDEGFCDEH
jgi:acetylornithine deacetylase/succinyl-diaminopimelate desuccinylase-like protein